MNFLGKYPKKFKMLGKYLFGIKFYLENYAFGFLSVWEKMFWKKIHLGKYPTANWEATMDLPDHIWKSNQSSVQYIYIVKGNQVDCWYYYGIIYMLYNALSQPQEPWNEPLTLFNQRKYVNLGPATFGLHSCLKFHATILVKCVGGIARIRHRSAYKMI